MQDAEREKPICGDTYAKAFMNEQGLQILEAFKDETRPNTSNVGRHVSTYESADSRDLTPVIDPNGPVGARVESN